MLDIRLALKWVRNHAAAFGGDAGNVTLSGFSAGARDVLNCTISPVMKGLFDKVISFSGGPSGKEGAGRMKSWHRCSCAGDGFQRSSER